MQRVPRTLLPILTALCAFAIVLTPTIAQSGAFLEPFDGSPPAPAAYQNPHNWGIFSQGFDTHFNGQAGQVAQHGPACEPPDFPYTAGNTHPLRSEADTVFMCNDHVMTAVGLAGYGAVYMQVPAVAVLNPSAVISWNMSTLRTAARDWVDVTLTPWAEQSEMAYNNLDQHIPLHNIHIALAGTNVFLATQRIGGGQAYNQGRDVQLSGDTFTTWDTVFQANGVSESASRRDRFEVTLTRTTLSVCLSDYAYQGQRPFCWLRNAPLAEPLDPAIWNDQVAVQLGHRSYNPEKSCVNDQDPSQVLTDGHSPYADVHCPPNTWHWDNVSVQPYQPFEIVKSVPEILAIRTTSPTRVNFASPAPADSYLTFVQFGETSQLRISWDNGSTWNIPRLQPAVAPSTENGEAIFTPAPTGATSVMVRGANGFWGGYGVEAFKLVGRPDAAPKPRASATATAQASATATAQATATATATALATATPTATVASTPSGLHVEGNRLVDGGATVQLRGVNRSGTEYMCSGSSGTAFDGPSDAASIAAIKAWGVNSVRVPLNEDCWLGLNGIPQAMTAQQYRQQISDYIALLTANGLYAIVDLHWSAPGTLQSTGQREMPDADHSPAFWTSVATAFAPNHSVVFDLFNEPHDIEWACLRDGGTCAGLSYQAAGMQTLLNAVRATGARNVVLVPGNGWAGDMSRWIEFAPVDPQSNIAASWHQYNFGGCTTAQCWDADLVPVLAQVPLVAGEIGENDCAHGFVDGLMNWLDEHGASYLAWSWSTYDCGGFPSLIASYSGTPTAYGEGVKAHLGGTAGLPTAVPTATATPGVADVCVVYGARNGTPATFPIACP